MKKKAIIISIKGYKLLEKEREILKNEKPWGLILFKRNINNLNQIKKLVKEIRIVSKDRKFPIMIDEEGSSVTRLGEILYNNISQKNLGDFYLIEKKISLLIYKNYIKKITSVLKDIGININTVPVLDVLQKETHKIIEDRCFSRNKNIVKKLGKFCIKHYEMNKVGTVIKHIPGHGCASSDSHFKMPIVKKSLQKLKEIDFFPFKSSKSKFAMTAHIRYENIDKKNVATFSKRIIKNVIRKKMRFKGILISDDISMKALKYNLLENAKRSLSAGCNLVLYCSGNYRDAHKLVRALPFIDKFTAKKTSEFYKFLR